MLLLVGVLGLVAIVVTLVCAVIGLVAALTWLSSMMETPLRLIPQLVLFGFWVFGVIVLLAALFTTQ